MDYPIRVLVLDTVMDRGGAETMTMNYYRNIDRNKVQFDFLVHRDYKAAYEDEIIALGGKIYRICPPYPQNYFKYQKIIRKFFHEHPEYKIIHSNMMYLSLFTFIAAKKCKVPIRICHSHTSESTKQFSVQSLIRWVYRKVTPYYSTHYFACGQKAGEWMFGTRKDVTIMPNAVDAQKFRYNISTENEVREEFNLQGKFVVGHVGRFFDVKNHPFMIDAFSLAVQKCPEAVLMLVGGGELDDERMNAAKAQAKRLGILDKVIFTGVRTDVERIVQAFDVFILPSLQEGFPVVMVEAQAAGLKCMISDRVPPECDVTGNVEILPLSAGEKVWAEHILAYKDAYKKQDMYEKIVEAGFDIKENAQWLQNFYLNISEGLK